ncbi:MAG: glycine--tRNA ligase subunit beta [Betaproteobacteria bacterium]|nr:glycine--tRNA ligase subunit beta [Betaproteobacteria bacterium]
MTKTPLLVELLTEELPPKALKTIGDAFSRGIFDGLKSRGFLAAQCRFEGFATPRRLAVFVDSVLPKSPDRPSRQKILPVNVGVDASGKPTQALEKKLAALNLSHLKVSDLEKAPDGKAEAFFYNFVASGSGLVVGLQSALEDTVARLPIPKVMRYQTPEGKNVQFVRPAHGLVAVYGDEVVPVSALSLEAGRTTFGHRFLGCGEIRIGRADDYPSLLEQKGRVVAGFESRRERIRRQLIDAARGARVILPEALLDEVTALVEWPVVYEGQFDPAFLAVPQECLILTMQQNQKYFALTDGEGKLLPRFLIVSNLETADPSSIVHGNERVLRARLADAKFFFDQDRKQRLQARVPRLASVVFHNKLGSQLARVQRIQKLAGAIARKLGADVSHAERAAHLCKADLLTDMVGEFPELQGTMGQYYARHDGEPDAVARAIEAHYQPRFAGDSLPGDNIGAAVALADKLDTLVGIFGIGLAPTGEKDPFGLRRHGLGVLRLLSEKALPLELLQLLQLARSQYPSEALADSVAVDLHGFMLERLKNYLRDKGYRPDEIEAVVSQNPTRIDLVAPRLTAVQSFRKLPEAEALAAANKRIQNILKKTTVPGAAPDLSLMEEPAERALFAATAHLNPVVSSLLASGDYTDALCALAQVRKEVDTFFDEVMVMTDMPLVRDNRLALLRQLGDLMNQVADISKLAS